MDSVTFVVGIIATFRRETELARLLKSLGEADACVVVDNAALSSTAELVRQGAEHARYVACPENPGPGAAWRLGMETALQEWPGLTHFLVLDDDVELPPDAAGRMLAVMRDKGAAMVCPMLLDASGEVWGFPEPLEVPLRKTIREVRTPGDARRLLGTAAREFAWCTGACVLVSRAAVERAGMHRTDFWMLGEDLEFSMRMSFAGGGWFLPEVCVPHLPPPATDPVAARQADRVKFCSLLQNLAWLAFHSPHSCHLRSYLPGNVRRYFRTHGWHWDSLREVTHCLWWGAVRGEPAGRESGKRVRRSLTVFADNTKVIP